MFGKSMPASSVRYLALITFFMFTAGLSSAQTPVKSPEDLKTEPETIAAPRLKDTEVASTSVVVAGPTATADPTKPELNLMNAVSE